METIQIVLDKKLLMAADRAAKRSKVNRSALVREALREHLQRMELQAKEDRDRAGYLKQPQMTDEWETWEKEAVWPEE
ncbi:MAG: ribbon-helix-helix domain-containing protein [Terracidiphilus sp.]